MCVYACCENSNSQVFVNLLCAKTKVTSLQTIMVPKLELCGAFVLARLVTKVKMTINVNIDSYHFWSDSTIILR